MFVSKFQIEFLKLVDITHEMTEPCIIDIKIGKRTWDPLASEEKMMEEKVRVNKSKLRKNIKNFNSSKNTRRVNKTLDSGKFYQNVLLETDFSNCHFLLACCSIPGFQVYDITTGRIKRYGKEYGKKLNESTVKDGIRK